MDGAYCIAESDALGRHLVAARALAVGEEVLCEAPRVFWHNRRRAGAVRSCEECGRVVGGLAELAAGATVDPGDSLPSMSLACAASLRARGADSTPAPATEEQRAEYAACLARVTEKLLPVLAQYEDEHRVPAVPCRGAPECAAVFCCQECREGAAHNLMCASAAEDGAGALREYTDAFGFNERFMFLLAHHARYWRAGAGDDEEEGLLGVDEYDDAGMPLRPTAELRPVLRQAAELLTAVLGPHGVPPVAGQSLLRLLNIYNANCHTAVTLSPLYTLRAALREKNDASNAAAVALLDDFFALADPSSLHASGAALFRDAACANHACAPTCRVVPTQHRAAVSMRAVRAVAPGEHLTISYIDAAAFAGRPFARAEALAPYGFKCLCDLCAAERAVHAAAWLAAALAVLAA